jgi:hypothetical protein
MKIPYNKANVPIFWTTSGSKQYRVCKVEFDSNVDEAKQEPTAFNSTVVTDDEAEE